MSCRGARERVRSSLQTPEQGRDHPASAMEATSSARTPNPSDPSTRRPRRWPRLPCRVGSRSSRSRAATAPSRPSTSSAALNRNVLAGGGRHPSRLGRAPGRSLGLRRAVVRLTVRVLQQPSSDHPVDPNRGAVGDGRKQRAPVAVEFEQAGRDRIGEGPVLGEPADPFL